MNESREDVKGKIDCCDGHVFECGCAVTPHGRMKRCPKHAAAPEMYGALQLTPCTSGHCTRAREKHADNRLSHEDYKNALCFRCSVLSKIDGGE